MTRWSEPINEAEAIKAVRDWKGTFALEVGNCILIEIDRKAALRIAADINNTEYAIVEQEGQLQFLFENGS